MRLTKKHYDFYEVKLDIPLYKIYNPCHFTYKICNIITIYPTWFLYGHAVILSDVWCSSFTCIGML